MSKPYETGKRCHRLVPCPSYEITKIETWLSDLANEGLILVNDGIFAGVATFEYKGPQKVKYRLEAARGGTGTWADNGGDPDPEQIEISRKYSWEYVAKLRDFHIYRSFDPEARELNTDPGVQAMALDVVRKRARDSLISSLLYFLIYPLAVTRGCLLLTTITLGTGWMILALALGFLAVANEIRAFIRLKKLQRSLEREGCINADPDWKKGRGQYFSRRIAAIAFGIFLVFSFLITWGTSVTDENKVSLDEYRGTVPFATIKDFAGDGYSEYSLTMSGLFHDVNTIEEGKDWIAPRFTVYNEHAKVKTADGNVMDGGLYVEYCELCHPILAKCCAKELYRMDRFRSFFRSLEMLDTPKLDADYAVAYRNETHFPTVIIQRGRVAVRAYFFQTSDYALSLDEWSQIICDSIRN